MTPRERILTAIDHRESDRTPIDVGGTDCSSVHVIAYDRLRKHLDITPRPVRISGLTQLVADVDDEIRDRLGADTASLNFAPRRWKSWKTGYGFDAEVPELWSPETTEDGADVINDDRGIARKCRPKGGLYFDPVSFALADVQSPEDLDGQKALFNRWDWPVEYDEPTDQYASRASALRKKTDRAIIAGWRMHYLQAGQFMRGYEQFMVDMLADELLARAILDRLHGVYVERLKTFLAAVGPACDIVFFTDDFGAQNGTLISPELFRRLIKPYWAEVIGIVRKAGKKVLLHSCGSISAIIPDLIEIGVDALNPVQITAAGMDPTYLKHEFGKDITFWGGGISTQGVLNGADVNGVRDAVKRNVEILGKNGGFVFTAVHNIQHDVPPENIVAAFETAMQM